VSGARAGALAAALWAGTEPFLRRIFRTEYSDVRLLATTLAPGAPTSVALAAHIGTGAALGAAFERLGGRGWRAGVAAFELETILAWPAIVVVTRRRGRLSVGGRSLVLAMTTHALFGALVGAWIPKEG
jgi:hypothetical protein